MIYKKDANFPYPILTNTSNAYNNAKFHLVIGLDEIGNDYCFEPQYDISSEFIKSQIQSENASLILVVQNKDTKFYEMDQDQKFIKIPRERISIKEKTSIQLLIKAKEDISFINNEDLSDFYGNFKESILVPKNSILGLSNIITLNVIKKPQELFEKKIDPNLKGPFEIELSNETIILKFKNENYQFVDIPNNRDLNNAYIREGLGRAVINFVINNGEENVVEIDEIDPPEVELDFKLYNLMKSRNVKEVSLENIDEVVNIIGNNIIEKFTNAVRGLYNGN
ncbi:hypothetical protein SAMN02745147_2435 [Intestinibacter bartlettii DSM 16795]|uniref:hypothetical protein n=1 Tax=Intestinibacter bartlettii TaxID=261299 RepID=UPI0001631429|nr:hypothetical protein [Intestinibacter bartlettii]EDQ97421.1 hypothetical protein CLOBAR_00697 [Intestinibacter bartlettii DSM 16795]UWO81347.1 hypothetical protein NQ514_02350 [Intestinibacter bartlettii]SKA60061.1 hypothetical protein SAMN02745147_2435 [Intestinibacter bartlettii DSM 16795]